MPGQGAPYGGPQGWYPPQPQKTNVAAVVALVMSVVCAIPFVPLILGFVALSQIRKNGEKGKGLAIAAIVIHGATIAFYAIVLAIGLSGGLDDGTAPRRDTGGRVTVPEQSASPGANAGASPGASPRERRRDVEDIRKGDCFNTEDDLAKTEEGAPRPGSRCGPWRATSRTRARCTPCSPWRAGLSRARTRSSPAPTRSAAARR
ncbi:DUF4190 domain-containing protein [Streptomyces globosus]|uniref:DUF4190 domain-containing protein n=1 Tax=Streptomyces globosus TaxID=68209 RepID=UPI003637A165